MLKKIRLFESITLEINLLYQNKALAENFILHFYLILKYINLYYIEIIKFIPIYIFMVESYE